MKDGAQMYLGMLIGGAVDGLLCEFNGSASPGGPIDLGIPDEFLDRVKAGDMVTMRPYRMPGNGSV
jgi:hypothetical protein